MNEPTAPNDWSETELRGLRVLTVGGAAVEGIAAITRRSSEGVSLFGEQLLRDFKVPC